MGSSAGERVIGLTGIAAPRPQMVYNAKYIMMLNDLFFLLCLLIAAVMLLQSAALAIRGQRIRALAKLRNLGIGVAAYFAIVFAVAAASPRKSYRIGDAQCFDDWCIAVTGAARTAPDIVKVDLLLSSRAKRVPQGEKGTVVYLLDARGKRYNPQPDPAAIPFDTQLEPGESRETFRRFAVPPDAGSLDLIYTNEGGFPIGFFIIGENDCVHGPPVVRLGRIKAGWSQ